MGLNISSGDIVRLTMEPFSVTNCTHSPEVRMCFISCGPVTGGFGYYFQEGAEYVIYADALPGKSFKKR